MSLILFITYWLTALLVAIMQYKINRSMKNIVLENTLPDEALKSPEIEKILKDFLKKLLLSVVFFGLVLCASFFIQYDSVNMFLFFLAMFGNLGLQFVINVKAIEEVHDLKIQKGWSIGTQKVLVDIQALKVKNRKVFPIWWFAIPFGIFAGLVAYQVSSQMSTQLILINSLSFLLLFVLSVWLYFLVKKMPVKPLTIDSQTNMQMNDVQKSFWCKTVLSLLVFSLVFGFSITFFSSGEGSANLLAFALMMIFTIGFVAYTIALVFGYRKQTTQLLTNAQKVFYENEDQYWKYGVYINPNDSRLFVPSRMNMNLGVNLGKPAGKILAIVTAIALFIGLGVLLMFLGYNDFTPQPFRLNEINSGQTVELHNFISSRTIETSDIKSVELVPISYLNKATRNVGSATNSYRTGSFSLNDRELYLLIFNNVDRAVKIQTANRDYFVNQRTLEQTQELYQKLVKLAE